MRRSIFGVIVALVLFPACAAGDVRPPALVVEFDGSEQKVQSASYCWRDGAEGVCSDGVPDFSNTIDVPAEGEPPRLRWQGETVQVRVVPAGEEVPALVHQAVADGSPLPGDLQPGEYDVYVSGQTSSGQASFGFRLSILEP